MQPLDQSPPAPTTGKSVGGGSYIIPVDNIVLHCRGCETFPYIKKSPMQSVQRLLYGRYKDVRGSSL